MHQVYPKGFDKIKIEINDKGYEIKNKGRRKNETQKAF